MIAICVQYVRPTFAKGRVWAGHGGLPVKFLFSNFAFVSLVFSFLFPAFLRDTSSASSKVAFAFLETKRYSKMFVLFSCCSDFMEAWREKMSFRN